MKIKDLIAILNQQDPEMDLVIMDNGSALKTGTIQETIDYNQDNNTKENFLLTEEY